MKPSHDPPTSRRHVATPGWLPALSFRPGAALRKAFQKGYGWSDLRRDVLAGLVVGVVALPLSMALAIATGVPPQHGLYTAIVAGGLAAALGGSKTQVTGPTAAFVVVLVPISARYGLGGLLLATMMAGVILCILGIGRLGRLIEFIPYPVTSGFTAGIAVVIATLQVKDVFGLTTGPMPEHYSEKVAAIARAMPTVHWPDVALGALTLAVLVLWPRITRKLPAPLLALTLAALVGWLCTRFVPGFDYATIGNRFSYDAGGVAHPGIPQMPPTPVLPWELAGPDGRPVGLSFELLRDLFPSAFAIAILGAIESLLSAVVADGMSSTKHDPDAELLAQGVGNIVAPFFGGFAATGAIARTATNIRSGARSPVAAITHALFLLVAVVALAPLLAYLPMAALAALLLVVAYNMSEAKHFVHVLRVAPKSDVLVQLTCFSLTILFDMVVSVTAGVMLAALLFMRRMSEISEVRLADKIHPELDEPLPDGVALYEIAGPLFFGAAQKAMSSLDTTSSVRCVILDLRGVPAMDVTGLVNLESALRKLRDMKALVVLCGLRPQPAKVLTRAGIGALPGVLALAATLEDAIAHAREHTPPPPASWRPRAGRSSDRGAARSQPGSEE